MRAETCMPQGACMQTAHPLALGRGRGGVGRGSQQGEAGRQERERDFLRGASRRGICAVRAGAAHSLRRLQRHLPHCGSPVQQPAWPCMSPVLCCACMQCQEEGCTACNKPLLGGVSNVNQGFHEYSLFAGAPAGHSLRELHQGRAQAALRARPPDVGRCL